MGIRIDPRARLVVGSAAMENITKRGGGPHHMHRAAFDGALDKNGRASYVRFEFPFAKVPSTGGESEASSAADDSSDARAREPTAPFPIRGHFDAATPWKLDDPALATDAWAPQTNFARFHYIMRDLTNDPAGASGPWDERGESTLNPQMDAAERYYQPIKNHPHDATTPLEKKLVPTKARTQTTTRFKSYQSESIVSEPVNIRDLAAYVKALPRRTGGVLDWPEEDVKTLLAGSPSQRAAYERQASVDGAIEEIRAEFPQLTPGALRWAFDVLFSRLIRLPNRGGELALVPWADMLNHKPGCNAYIDDSGSKVCLQPDRAYKPGEQVFASYGQRPSAELLISYGFAPEVGENPDDEYEITLGIDPNDRYADAKAAALEKIGLRPVESFPLRLNGYPKQLLQYASFALCDPDDPKELEGLAEKAGEKFAFDSYRRFLDMYGDVVMGVEHALFEREIASLKRECGVVNDNDLNAVQLRELVKRYERVYETAGRALDKWIARFGSPIFRYSGMLYMYRTRRSPP